MSTSRANVAAQIMEHLVSCPEHGYSQPGRHGTSGYCSVETDVGTIKVKKGDRDCSSAVCEAWELALAGTAYDGKVTRYNGKADGGAAASEVSSGSSSAGIDALAQRVVAGEFGNGDARRAALGDKYGAVQARVNEMLGGGSGASGGSVNVDELARAVINGDYGNGDERRERLGANYEAVQKRVNELLS